MGTSLAVQWLRLNDNNKRTHVRTMRRERAARGGPEDQVGRSQDTQQTLVRINIL